MNTSRKSYTSIILVIVIIILGSCVKIHSDPIEFEELILLETFDLDISEPAGLSQSYLPDHFYTVSDNKGIIYLINKYGEILQSLNIGGNDLEDIVFVEETLSLYAVDEKLRWIFQLTPGGTVLDTFKLDIPTQNINDGPEGIAYNPGEKLFYIVNEKNPAMLFLYDTLFHNHSEYPLNFANDYSSIDYEQEGNHLWIISEESKLLARCNLKGEPEEIFHTGVPKGEGILIDSENDLIYIVCNFTSKLYIFKLPDNQYHAN